MDQRHRFEGLSTVFVSTASVEFLVGDGMPLDVVIGRPTLGSLDTNMDIGHRYVTGKIYGTEV